MTPLITRMATLLAIGSALSAQPILAPINRGVSFHQPFTHIAGQSLPASISSGPANSLLDVVAQVENPNNSAYAGINQVHLFITNSMTQGFKCHLVVGPTAGNAMWMTNDGDDAWQPQGSAGTLYAGNAAAPNESANSQCRLYDVASEVWYEASVVFIKFRMAFQPNIANDLSLGLAAQAARHSDGSSSWSSLDFFGSFNVISTNYPPYIYSLHTESGETGGDREIFTAYISDPNGVQDVAGYYLEFVQGSSKCKIQVALTVGAVAMWTDNGSAWQGYVWAGSEQAPRSVANSSCLLRAWPTRIHYASPTTLSVELAVEFKAAMAQGQAIPTTLVSDDVAAAQWVIPPSFPSYQVAASGQPSLNGPSARGGTAYGFFQVDSTSGSNPICDRVPYNVVANYDLQKSVIDQQLKNMYWKDKQSSLYLPIWYSFEGHWCTGTSLRGPDLGSNGSGLKTACSDNLAAILTKMGSIGFKLVKPSLAPQGVIDPWPNWPSDWISDAELSQYLASPGITVLSSANQYRGFFNETWLVVQQVKGILEQVFADTGLDFLFDLNGEQMPSQVSGNPQAMLAMEKRAKLLWKNYVQAYYAALQTPSIPKTAGFSVICDGSGSECLSRLAKISTVYGLTGKYPEYLDLHNYDDPSAIGSAIAWRNSQSQNPGIAGMKITVGETYYQDSGLALTYQNYHPQIIYLWQFPLAQPRPPDPNSMCNAINRAPEYSFSVYRAKGF